MGLAEAIILKCNAEREKYLSVYDVIEIINSDDTDLVIHIMDSSGLFSLTVYELNNLDPYNPIYKPVCNSYELKQKVRDYINARRQFIHEDNNFDENMTLQRCLKKNLWSRFDLLKIEEIVKNTRLIVWGDSNALYSMYSDMINRSDSEYYELSESSQQAIKDYVNLGSYQRELINLVSYSPEQIICLMTNDDPARINRDEKYRVYWDMVSTALDANELTPINEKEEIRAEQVKAWLAKRGFIYKNFNDRIMSDTDNINRSSQQLMDTQENIAPFVTKYDKPQSVENVHYEHTVYPAEPLENKKLHTDLGEFQKELITYDVFKLNQIVCLILNYPPNASSNDSQFISYLFQIEESIKSGELVPFNKEQHIGAEQVKVWLARNNYIYEGFNDNIPADPAAQIRQLTAQIAQLTAQNKELREQRNSQPVAPADDADLNPKTLSAVTRLLNVLFHKAELDIKAHKGTTNKNIVNSSKSLNAKITEKPVSYWIKQVQQLRIDTQDSNN